MPGQLGKKKEKQHMLKMVIVILVISTASIFSGNKDGAYEFVKKIYSNYESNLDFNNDYTKKKAESIFSKEFLALLRKDIQTTPKGEVGFLDWDPICSCQDWGDFKINKIEIITEKDKTIADVYFTNLGSKTNVKLYLVKENNKWLIDDIVSENMKSLKNELKEYLDTLKQKK